MRQSKQKTRGFILFITLIFSQMIALIGLYALSVASQDVKEIHLLQAREHILHQSNEILSKIEQRIGVELDSCRISVLPPDMLKNQSESWWQLNACSDNEDNIRYDYVIESIARDDCANVEVGGRSLAADYERLTLRVNQVLFMQSTWVRPVPRETVCRETMHLVATGRQMKRELI